MYSTLKTSYKQDEVEALSGLTEHNLIKAWPAIQELLEELIQ